MTEEKRDPNARANVGSTEVQNLVLSDNIKLPSTFSPEIASISLRSPDNNLQDGYALRLSAHFGVDTVELELDNCIILANMRLNQARIELEFAKCKPAFGAHYEDHATARTLRETRSVSSIKEHNGYMGGEAEASVSALMPPSAKMTANLHGSVKGGGKVENTSEETVEKRSFSHVNIDKLTVKPMPEQLPLNGAEIFEYEGWRVIPAKDAKSGVLAVLKVKSDWIEIEEVDVINKLNGAHQVSKVAAWIDGSKGSLERRRQLFKVLLSNLVHLKLQDPRERVYANLDCAVLCVEPESDDYLGKDAEHQTLNLNLSEKLLEEFINAPTDQEAQEIAEHPDRFLKPELIYEFPLCTPCEVLDALGVTIPRSARKKSWAQLPSRVSTMSEVEKDIAHLAIPRRHDYKANYTIDKSISDPIEYVRKRAARVSIIAGGVQAASFENFGGANNERSLSSFFGRDRKAPSMSRRVIDAHFQSVFAGRISAEQINRRIAIATCWVEFVRDSTH
jgi:hypothetical protein